MILRKAYKFKMQPTRDQRVLLAQFAGCVRLVWNKALALEKESLTEEKKVISYNEMAGNLTAWKKQEETNFLKLVHSQPLQQILKDLDRALKDSFKKEKGFPRFKKKDRHDSFRYPQGFKIEGRQVYLPKIGWVKFRKSQEIDGLIKNVTVSKYCGEWYVSFQIEKKIEDAIHIGPAIGIDVGIAKFAAVSDGEFHDSVNAYRTYENKLKKEQRKLSRKEKGSNNRKKQIYRVKKIHKKIADTRRDFLHKISTWITKNHGVIYIEDLKVSNMSKSAKGTVDDPGRNVKAKSGLNKSILDQGWYEFRRQLTYKSEWLGGQVIAVNPRNTSRTCPECQHISKDNRKSQAEFKCVSCGYSENADYVGSLNIRRSGEIVAACGSNHISGRKQEPVGKGDRVPIQVVSTRNPLPQSELR